MNRAFYVLIFLAAINLVITIYGFVDQSVSQPQVVYIPTDKSDPATAAAPTVPTIAVKLPDEKILRDMIQSALKQELGPYVRQFAATSEPSQKVASVDPPGVKENSPANAQAWAEASNIVSVAIARGAWTREDNVALIPHVPQLTQSQRYKIMDEVGQAINRQELKIEDVPPAL